MLIHKSFLATVIEPDGSTVSVPSQLSWTDTNPFAVRADFKDGSSWIEWTFALALLESGLASTHAVKGEGDVKVTSIKVSDEVASVRLFLSSPEGQGTADLPWETVNAFCDEVANLMESSPARTAKAVQVSLDSFLRELGVSA